MDRFQFLNKQVINNDSLVYFINRAGFYSETKSDFNIARNSSYPYCVIHYVIDGEGAIVYKNKKFLVKKGQVFLLNAYEAHQYKANSHNPLKLNWIEFSGSDCNRLMQSCIDNNSPIVIEPYSTKINNYMLRILYLLKNGYEEKYIKISKLIYSILMILLELQENNIYENIPINRISDINKVLKYIDNNLDDTLSIEQLSKIANFSPTYFAKLFHKTVGLTPKKYILMKRINRAKEILSINDKSIEIISDSLGFCNTSHFIRLFKKAEGLTPAEYRKQCNFYNQSGF